MKVSRNISQYLYRSKCSNLGTRLAIIIRLLSIPVTSLFEKIAFNYPSLAFRSQQPQHIFLGTRDSMDIQTENISCSNLSMVLKLHITTVSSELGRPSAPRFSENFLPPAQLRLTISSFTRLFSEKTSSVDTPPQ